MNLSETGPQSGAAFEEGTVRLKFKAQTIDAPRCVDLPETCPTGETVHSVSRSACDYIPRLLLAEVAQCRSLRHHRGTALRAHARVQIPHIGLATILSAASLTIECFFRRCPE